MTQFKNALLAAAKAFIVNMEGAKFDPFTKREIKKTSQIAAPTPTSNGIPVCPDHGTNMRQSKFKKNEYYCGQKLEDGEGYCRNKGIAS